MEKMGEASLRDPSLLSYEILKEIYSRRLAIEQQEIDEL